MRGIVVTCLVWDTSVDYLRDREIICKRNVFVCIARQARPGERYRRLSLPPPAALLTTYAPVRAAAEGRPAPHDRIGAARLQASQRSRATALPAPHSDVA
jgi:hypothetical protein